jgi:Fe-S oxidoreductase
MSSLTKEQITKGLNVLRDQPDNRLLSSINSCVHCGLCAESCLYYLATKDDRLIPARKVEIVAAIYKRYETIQGRIFPGLTGARELNKENAAEMVDLLYGSCTLCGRCSIHCSIGLDIPYIVKTGRAMLSEMGMVPASLQSTVRAAMETGNNMGIPETEFTDTLKWMEEELADEVNDPEAKIPVNEPGKRVLYTLNPREPKFFPLSISAMAKIFYAAKESWTLSTKMYDITNYAYFSGNKEEEKEIGRRLWDEMKNLHCQTLVLAECGHGTLAFRWNSPNNLQQPFPFNVKSSVEWIAGYLRDGKIRLNKDLIREPVTLHDPCNLVRNGGVISEQRYILKEFISDFREMTPHGADNFCCGGGGGQLAMSEYNDRRMKTAEIKAEQIRKTGAKIVVSPCHNCVDQLTQINMHFKLGVRIKTMAEIVADALVL